MPPETSICIPTYNYGRHIGTAIESALRQSKAPHEVVVSDDGSTDNTMEVLEKWRAHIRVVQPGPPRSLAKNYHFALSQSTGSHVLFLSADDALDRNFLKVAEPLCNDHAMVATGGFECDLRLRVRQYHYVKYLGLSRLQVPQGFLHFTHGIDYRTSGTVFSKQPLMKLTPLPLSAHLVADWYYGLGAALWGPIRFVARPLHYYRRHEENASSTKASARWWASAFAMWDFVVEQWSLTEALREAAERRAALCIGECERAGWKKLEEPARGEVAALIRKWERRNWPIRERESLLRRPALGMISGLRLLIGYAMRVAYGWRPHGWE